MPMFNPKRLHAMAALFAVSWLAACSSSQEEIQGWMDAERNKQRSLEQSIQAPQKFTPETYAGANAVDPFNEQKLTVVLKQNAAQPNSIVASELNRRKEPLEAFPLDSVKLVGSVKRKGVQFGLLKVDNLLYQVKVGDYLGQNYGKIMKITETDISIREIVQDAVGEWTDRPATLQLQEEAQ
jgi:type IV pilus assembly protein PilP